MNLKKLNILIPQVFCNRSFNRTGSSFCFIALHGYTTEGDCSIESISMGYNSLFNNKNNSS